MFFRREAVSLSVFNRHRMRQFLLCLGLLIISFQQIQAQWSASGSSKGQPFAYEPTAVSGMDVVYVYDDMAGAVLEYATDQPSAWTWSRFERSEAEAQAVDPAYVQSTATATRLLNVQAGYAYRIQSGSISRFVYIVSYQPTEVTSIQSIEPETCTERLLQIQSTSPELLYYGRNGLAYPLQRIFSLQWTDLEWNEDLRMFEEVQRTKTSQSILSPWLVDAPLCSTHYALKGDDLSAYYDQEILFQSSLFPATSVQMKATAKMVTRDALNELDRPTELELSGSAPLKVQLQSYSSPAAQLIEWWIRPAQGNEGQAYRFTDELLTYTFQKSGTYEVVGYAHSTSCVDSVRFQVTVLESFLDCPNFFTPRSTPGDNDEFRVAYRSIVSFHGVILNRWGNKLFEWTDPAQGWDGNFQGKPVSPGVYFYIIKATGSEGKAYTKRGDINLLE